MIIIHYKKGVYNVESISILNYQGNKGSLMDFISYEISNFVEPGDTIVDIFSGSGTVGNELQKFYKIIANDAEKYASLISEALLQPPSREKLNASCKVFIKELDKVISFKREIEQQNIAIETELIKLKDNYGLINFYSKLPTVWNNVENNITPDMLRIKNEYNLFQYYYAGTYFSLLQCIEIDSIIKLIKNFDKEVQSILYSCLFFAMKECVFSKDGHMAQPLNIEKNQNRHIKQREKSVQMYFYNKLEEFNRKTLDIDNKNDNIVFHSDFLELLNDNLLKLNPKLIYADPPYTDMQYSRYYHLLNVAAQYDYPELTIIGGKYTKGLYTEGRNQSLLSKRSTAKKQLEKLIQFTATNDICLALSYAYPEDIEKQAVDRYTVTIEDLISMAELYYSPDRVHVKRKNYKHANHRNSNQKKVFEYLIICGDPLVETEFDVRKLKQELKLLTPTSKNDLYNSHLYWSQKSYNVIDTLIKNLSNEGDIVFDPFMGSGVTVLQAINKENNRIGIGCDVNEMPNFICRTILNDMFSETALNTLENFYKELNSLLFYYETSCPICNASSTITKVLFDKPDRTINKFDIHSINYVCTICGKGVKKPDSNDYEKIYFSKELKNIEDSKLIKNSKIAVGENDKISYIFTPRNFSILDEIVGLIKKHNDQELLKYLLMSVIHLSKITDTHSNSQWPLWIPKKNCVEKNVVELLQKRIKNIEKTITYINKNYYPNSIVSSPNELNSNRVMLLHKGSQLITKEEIPDNSVSLIITDPPYMEQVMYSEYMQLYHPFLNLDFNLEDEVVVSSANTRNKDKRNYFLLLDEVFKICAQKLKTNAYMCLFFHDSNLEVWSELIKILEKNGFKFISQEHIKKTKTVKNILSPKKSLNGDAVLFFQNTGLPLGESLCSVSIEEIADAVYKQSKLLILQNGPMSTPELYDNGIMEFLIHNGWLHVLSKKYKSLVEIFEDRFLWEKESGKWKLG